MAAREKWPLNAARYERSTIVDPARAASQIVSSLNYCLPPSLVPRGRRCGCAVGTASRITTPSDKARRVSNSGWAVPAFRAPVAAATGPPRRRAVRLPRPVDVAAPVRPAGASIIERWPADRARAGHGGDSAMQNGGNVCSGRAECKTALPAARPPGSVTLCGFQRNWIGVLLFKSARRWGRSPRGCSRPAACSRRCVCVRGGAGVGRVRVSPARLFSG